MAEQEDEAKEFVDRFLEMRKNKPDIREDNSNIYRNITVAFALISLLLFTYLEFFKRLKVPT